MKIDLTDIEERRKAVEMGYIWSAPDEAIRHALRDMAAGLIATPSYIPNEWVGVANGLGVTANRSGFAEGQGPS